MTQTNYNERLTRLLEAHANWAHRWDKEAPTTYIYGTAKVSDTIDTKSALTQLFKDLVAEAIQQVDYYELDDSTNAPRVAEYVKNQILSNLEELLK